MDKNLTPEEYALKVFNSDDLLFNPYATGADDCERFFNELLKLANNIGEKS